jgi:hypothetical protein
MFAHRHASVRNGAQTCAYLVWIPLNRRKLKQPLSFPSSMWFARRADHSTQTISSKALEKGAHI